jgi:hypothetical protein
VPQQPTLKQWGGRKRSTHHIEHLSVVRFVSLAGRTLESPQRSQKLFPFSLSAAKRGRTCVPRGQPEGDKIALTLFRDKLNELL